LRAVYSYGLADRNTSLINAMTFDQNFPLWFGPWASGLTVLGSQEGGRGKLLKSLPWSDAAAGRIVVHASTSTRNLPVVCGG
jgi:hypothetical protein